MVNDMRETVLRNMKRVHCSRFNISLELLHQEPQSVNDRDNIASTSSSQSNSSPAKKKRKKESCLENCVKKPFEVPTITSEMFKSEREHLLNRDNNEMGIKLYLKPQQACVEKVLISPFMLSIMMEYSMQGGITYNATQRCTILNSFTDKSLELAKIVESIYTGAVFHYYHNKQSCLVSAIKTNSISLVKYLCEEIGLSPFVINDA